MRSARPRCSEPFFPLRVADAVTTVVALRLGDVEDNPLIHMFMSAGPVRVGFDIAKAWFC